MAFDIFLHEYNPTGYQRREHLVEGYDSFIWTERVRDPGDFELAFSKLDNVKEYFPGRIISHSKTSTGMVIEEVLVTEGSKPGFVVKGRCLKTVLENRLWIFRNLDGTPVKKKFFEHQKVDDLIIDRIESALAGIKPANTMEAAQAIPNFKYKYEPISYDYLDNVELDNGNFLSFLWAIQPYGRDARIHINSRFPNLPAGVEDGGFFLDLSIKKIRERVLFSTQNDTLASVRYYKSNKGYHNSAWATDSEGLIGRTYVGVSQSFEHRSIFGVDSGIRIGNFTDEDPPPEWALNALRSTVDQYIQSTLLASRPKNYYDGEISQNSPYEYGRDYIVGDIVFIDTAADDKESAEVEEYTFASDQSGYREFPSFRLVDISTGDDFQGGA